MWTVNEYSRRKLKKWEGLIQWFAVAGLDC